MLLLALVHYPEVLKKAQREIDRVVGTDRLPTFSDREQLPYVDCIIKEVLRWGTPVPISVFVLFPSLSNLDNVRFHCPSPSPQVDPARPISRIHPR